MRTARVALVPDLIGLLPSPVRAQTFSGTLEMRGAGVRVGSTHYHILVSRHRSYVAAAQQNRTEFRHMTQLLENPHMKQFFSTDFKPELEASTQTRREVCMKAEANVPLYRDTKRIRQ